MKYYICNMTNNMIVSKTRWLPARELTADEVLVQSDQDVERADYRWDGTTNIRPATQTEKDATKDAQNDVEADTLLNNTVFLKFLIGEINLLRTEAGLPTRTKAELKAAYKAKI